MNPIKVAAGVAALAIVVGLYKSNVFNENHVYNTHPLLKVKSFAERPGKPGDIVLGQYFRNKDGLYIYFRRFMPLVNAHPAPKAICIIVHGVGEHSGRYENVAMELNKLGVIVYAFDLVGHGRSEGDRGFIKTFQDYVDDVVLMSKIVKQSEGEKLKLFVLGHSMGGLITAVTLSQEQKLFDYAILSAPPIKVDPKQVSPITMALVRVLGTWLPRLEIDKLKLDKLVKDDTVFDIYLNDPMLNNGPMEARLGMELLAQVDAALEKTIPNIKTPFLLIHGTDDGICAFNGSEELFLAAKGVTDKKFERIEGGYHETLFEKGNALPAMVAWIKSKI